MVVTCDDFGKTNVGNLIKRYTLTNKNGVTVQVINLGAAITSIQVPDKNGKLDDIVAGYDTVAEYEDNPVYLGVIVGRFANRIHRGKFTLEGEEYQLPINNGPNCLHGGPNGFHKKLWDAEIDGSKVNLSCTSPDGEEGFPGDVSTTFTYELTDENELVIDYTATSTKPTPINLTNHSYFNLAGHKAKDIYDHSIAIFAERFTPKNQDNCPTGEVHSVHGTVFDLRSQTNLGDRIPNVKTEGEKDGFDHNFCLENSGERVLAARVIHEAAGRVMETYTTQPAVQLYTANYLDKVPGKDGAVYNQHSSLCLETQNYPDAINKSNFPDCVLRPGKPYQHTTCYKFITQK